MKNNSPFRNWVYMLWQNNAYERESWGDMPYTSEEYFNMHKWMLKREWTHKKRKIHSEK